jgi:hypothetical protein
MVCTGEDLPMIESSPSSPVKLPPHNHKDPSVLMAAVEPLIETNFQLVPPAMVCTGEDLVIVVLSPKLPPKLLFPQIHN